MQVEDFKEGDRVRHIGMGERGTVTIVESSGIIRVEYDRVGEHGRHWIGAYDRDWFRLHPDLLVLSG